MILRTAGISERQQPSRNIICLRLSGGMLRSCWAVLFVMSLPLAVGLYSELGDPSLQIPAAGLICVQN